MLKTKRNSLEDFLAENVLWVLISVLGTAIAVSLVTVLVFAANFHAVPISEQADAWGQFGDYVGGVLNPVFGFLSVLGLLVALVLQTKELRASRAALALSQRELELSRQAQTESAHALKLQNDAIRLQAFEQTFFAWFQSYKNLLQEVEAPTAEVPSGGMEGVLRSIEAPGMHRGVAALKQFWRRYLTEEGIQPHFMHLLSDDEWKAECSEFAPDIEAVDESRAPESNPSISRKRLIPSKDFKRLLFQFRQKNGPDLVVKALLNGWCNLYVAEGHQLGVVFRALYRLIKWVDEQPDSAMSATTKWQYVSIIRSQLSRYEQVLLFYNGMSDVGKKFQPFIERYALFDNLGDDAGPERLLFLVQWENAQGYPYSETAFSSEKAKAVLC